MTASESPDKMPVDPQAEHMYRRGYIAGVGAVLDQLPQKFSAAERKKIQEWLTELTRTWQVNNLAEAQRPPKIPM